MTKAGLLSWAVLITVASLTAAAPLQVYLASTPRAVREVEALAPNDFAAFEAYYRVADADASGPSADADLPLDEVAAVRVTYTTLAVPLPPSWPSTRCDEFDVRLMEEDPPAVCYAEQGWAVFIAFKEDFPWWRRFVGGFVRGLRFFLSFAQPNEVPFPAVVEVEGG